MKWQERANHADYTFNRLPTGEPMYTEVKTTNIPYALTRGPVVYVLDMVWNEVSGAVGNVDIMKDIRMKTNEEPVLKPMNNQHLLGPGYLVKGDYQGITKDFLMVPFANVGKWYKDSSKPKREDAAYSYAIWLLKQ